MESLKYSEILKQSSALIKNVESMDPYVISVLSNITCNQLQDILVFNLRRVGLNPEVRLGNYDNIVQESYNCQDSHMVIIHYDLMNVLDKYTDFIEDFTHEQIQSLIDRLKSDIDLILYNLQTVPTVIFNSFISCCAYSNALIPSVVSSIVQDLNEYLSTKRMFNFLFLDMEVPVAKVGLSNVFDYRMYYLSKTLYTVQFWKEYVYELSPVIYKVTGKLKKAIIFDCDNTLWKGILGEDGSNGIDMSLHSKIGQIYNKIQQIAVWLSKQGVIIGLCSKNNEDDVKEILEEHADIKLRPEHIVVRKINWLDKVTNLRNIAKELNIGLDSLVFVDDSPFEIELVKTEIPEILTFQVPVAIHEYPARLLQLIERYFYLFITVDDKRKVEQYKTQFQRNEEQTKYHSLEAYLSSLKLELEIKKNDFEQINRIAQLTQKTNQFNLTTKRYTESQINEFMNSDSSHVYSVSVRDKFGDSGLTAVCIILEQSGIATIDSFLMSCRVMGRNVEYAIMNYIMNHYKKRNFELIKAAYFSTEKNKPVSCFYRDTGFDLISQEGVNEYYSQSLSVYKPYNVEYIKIIK